MIRKIIFILSLLLTVSAFGQYSNSDIDTFPILSKDFEKTANWLKADSDRHFYYLNYGDTMNVEKAINVIRTEKDFWAFLQSKTYCIDNYKRSIPLLIALLTDTTKVGLQNTTDLIIVDRVKTGELEFYGHGGLINEDIFTVAGRCSYILNELTDENFALVHINTTMNELKIYQALWTSWFRHLLQQPPTRGLLP